MNALKIVALCVVAAVAYGIVHDQITARICIEYFTIGHPRIVESESPTVLGLVWGIVATWWVGTLLGVPLAVVSLRGPRPKRTAGSLVRPLLALLAVMASVASVAGVIGYLAASSGTFVLVEPLATRVPEERHVAFLTAGWAHSASYLVGFVGGVVLILRVRRERTTGKR